MLPEYHLYLLTLLLVGGLPAYAIVWVRRNRAAWAGQGPWPSRTVLLFYLFAVAIFVRHVAVYGPFPMRARQFEAQQNLGRVFYHQRRYRATHGEFAGGPRAFELLDYRPPWLPNNYALFCGDDVFGEEPEWFRARPTDRVTAARDQRLPIGMSALRHWPLRQVPASSATGYTCVAVGNVDWDGYPDVWTINNAKKSVNLIPDLWDPEPSEFAGPPRLYPDHPTLARLDPGAFYFDSRAVTVFLPALLAVLIGWEEWRRRKSDRPTTGNG